MIAASTSASSGLMTSSRSASALDGAIWSSGTSSPVLGNRYCTRLWWVSSVSSSMRRPVWRRTSSAAQVQNARCSSRVRFRRLPVVGFSAQVLAAQSGATNVRCRRVCPSTVNSGVFRAVSSLMAALARCAWTAAARAGSAGSRSRVRWSMRDLRRDLSLRRDMSSSRIGQGAAHGPQNGGFCIAHWAMSR